MGTLNVAGCIAVRHQIVHDHDKNKWIFYFSIEKIGFLPGLGDVLGQTTSPWAGPVHGWAGLGSNPLFEKNQPMARPTRYSFTLKRIGFVHRV